MRLMIRHEIVYSFSEPQQRLVELLRVTPASFAGQAVVDWRIDVDCDARLKYGRDGHGNETTMLYVNGPVSRIRLAVAGEVLTDDRAGMIVGSNEPLPALLYTRPSPLAEADEAITAFARETAGEAETMLGGLHRLMARLHERLAFDDRPAPEAAQSAAAVFAAGHGACRDHAHVMIAAARSLGLPARFVSGHLYRPEQDNEPRRSTHAWSEVEVPGYGWIGFDCARDHCPDDSYVRVAVGLDQSEAAPLMGARVGGGDEWLAVSVIVKRGAAQ